MAADAISFEISDLDTITEAADGDHIIIESATEPGTYYKVPVSAIG
jgi:hypothetical protein